MGFVSEGVRASADEHDQRRRRDITARARLTGWRGACDGGHRAAAFEGRPVHDRSVQFVAAFGVEDRAATGVENRIVFEDRTGRTAVSTASSAEPASRRRGPAWRPASQCAASTRRSRSPARRFQRRGWRSTGRAGGQSLQPGRNRFVSRFMAAAKSRLSLGRYGGCRSRAAGQGIYIAAESAAMEVVFIIVVEIVGERW